MKSSNTASAATASQPLSRGRASFETLPRELRQDIILKAIENAGSWAIEKYRLYFSLAKVNEATKTDLIRVLEYKRIPILIREVEGRNALVAQLELIHRRAVTMSFVATTPGQAAAGNTYLDVTRLPGSFNQAALALYNNNPRKAPTWDDYLFYCGREERLKTYFKELEMQSIEGWIQQISAAVPSKGKPGRPN